jgi:hypothetical protein
MFNALVTEMPSIILTQIELNLISSRNNVARYELVTSENGKLYSYEVVFITDKDGLWKIKEF